MRCVLENGVFYKITQLHTSKFFLMFYTSHAKSIISYGLLVYGCTSKHQLTHILHNAECYEHFFERKYDSMTCLMKTNGISNMYELYLFEVFKELFEELRAQSPLYVIADTVTLPQFSTRFRDKSFRTTEIDGTKMKERSVRNTFMIAYNLAMKLNLIPNKLNIMDNEELIREFF